MNDRVHYFSNGEEGRAWERAHCDRCLLDPDTCVPMGDMLLGLKSALVERFAGTVICHAFTTPPIPNPLVEWGRVAIPAPASTPVLDGQLDMFGGDA